MEGVAAILRRARKRCQASRGAPFGPHRLGGSPSAVAAGGAGSGRPVPRTTLAPAPPRDPPRATRRLPVEADACSRYSRIKVGDGRVPKFIVHGGSRIKGTVR